MRRSTMRLPLPARLLSSRQGRIRTQIRRTHEEASWNPSPMPTRVPLPVGPKTHPAPVAMVARTRTKPRSHASRRLPGVGTMKVLGQGVSRRTCLLLRLEETMAEVGESTICQGVAEIVLMLHRQGETETAHALRHLRLGGRRRALVGTSLGNPGQRRMSPMSAGTTCSLIRQTHDTV